MKKINVITLGCAKNIVDSERLMGRLEGAGWHVDFNDDHSDARVMVVNTCGFILDAKQESIEVVLSLARQKKRKKLDKLFVMGCLSQRYAEELKNEIPEVDGFFGVSDSDKLIEALETGSVNPDSPRKLTTPSHYAYLKISEGCNWGCGYCAIPLIRGRHISEPMEKLVAEAEQLAARGVKELIVIAQDTTFYGMDLYGERKLGELLRKLCKVEGIEWIRLHYSYPAQFPTDVIEAMRDEPKICKYLDIPIQHISDNVLGAMRRKVTKEETYNLIRTLRREIPDIALRTTLLVGYPGETNQDIAQLEEFVREIKFERLGVFPYSEEEGTYSAQNLADDVPEEEKVRRAERIIEIQREISNGHNSTMVGKQLTVITDRHEGKDTLARTQYDSPEVDNEVIIEGELLPVGQLITVMIDSADDYEIFATPVKQ